MIKSNQRYFNLLQVFLDCAVISVALLLAWYIRFSSPLFPDWVRSLDFIAYVRLLLIILPTYVILFYFASLYKAYRRLPFYIEAQRIFVANTIGLTVVLALLFTTKSIHFSRIMLGLYYLFSIAFMLIERGSIRKILRTARKRGYNLKHIIIVGAGKVGFTFANKITDDRQLGYNVTGFVDDYYEKGEKNGYRILGNTKEMANILDDFRVDEVVIALPNSNYGKINKLIDVCEYLGVKTQIIPDYFNLIQGNKPAFDEIDGIPLIYTRYIPLDEPFNRILKRVLDIIMSSAILILISPLLVVVAVLVKLTSPGPIIYRQIRVGLNRKEFNIYKFRSMRYDTGTGDTGWTTANDNRKTKFGSFIRKTSIDELPQFFNVIKGDMSVIGPRPERPVYVKQFMDEVPKYMIKHHVRPGITGWAQVNGLRGDTSIEERIKYDVEYIEKWTLWFDIKIFFMTFKALFKNAY